MIIDFHFVFISIYHVDDEQNFQNQRKSDHGRNLPNQTLEKNWKYHFGQNALGKSSVVNNSTNVGNFMEKADNGESALFN